MKSSLAGAWLVAGLLGGVAACDDEGGASPDVDAAQGAGAV